MEVKDITKPAVTISQEASFEEALKAMISGQTNTLLVTDENGELVGEVSVSDLLDAVVPEYLDGDGVSVNFATEEMFEEAVKAAKDRIVKEFMTADFSAVELEDGLMEVAATAIAHQRARMPVVDKDNHPVGIISRRGLKQIIARYLGIKDTI